MARIAYKLDIGRSDYLVFCLFLLHIIVIVIALTINIDLKYQISILLLVVASASYYGFCYYLRESPLAISTLERAIDGGWLIYYGDAHKSDPIELKGSYVSALVVVLYFKRVRFWPYKSVVVMFDAVDQELFRELRVYCRDPKTFLK
jgi:uncharacterized membrane protein YhaH (DUF805 family)